MNRREDEMQVTRVPDDSNVGTLPVQGDGETRRLGTSIVTLSLGFWTIL